MEKRVKRGALADVGKILKALADCRANGLRTLHQQGEFCALQGLLGGARVGDIFLIGSEQLFTLHGIPYRVTEFLCTLIEINIAFHDFVIFD